MISITLDGKTALITGGGQGLGAETARPPRQAGANVVVTFYEERAGANRVKAEALAAVIGFFGQANYAAARAGFVGLTKFFSRELGRKAITVNAVSPGVVLTDMGKSIPEEVRAGMLKLIPLEKFAGPRDIANGILFLASPMASDITGQTLHVNGGWVG